MSIIQTMGTVGTVSILFAIVIWFIITCIFGMIMKHFIREAIKEAFEEMGFYKRK